MLPQEPAFAILIGGVFLLLDRWVELVPGHSRFDRLRH